MFYAMCAFLILFALEVFALSGLGFYAMYELSGYIGLISSLAVVGVTLLIAGLLVWRFIGFVKKGLVKLLDDATKWLKSLSVKDIVKIILGILKK